MNRQLPKDWKWVKLGEVAAYLNGRAFKPTEWEETGNPIIRIQNLNNPEAKYNYSKKNYESKFKVEKGDLLFAWSASLGAYIWQGNAAWLNQHIFKVVPNEKTDKKYLFYLLEKIVQELYSKAHGSGMVHVTKGKFESTLIPFPSLLIQRIVVSKIEELFSELDKGIENLKTAQQHLKTYRQSVLKWAFEGKLVNCLNYDSSDSSDLNDLNKVQKNQKNQINHTNHSSDKGGLPKGWVWVKLKDITKLVTDGDHQAPPKAQEGIPFITISNVNKNNNKIDFTETYFVNREYYGNLKENRKPMFGDILYTVTGSFGIPVLIDFYKDFCFQRHIGLIRPLDNVNQKWLYYLLQSMDLYNQARDTATGTAQKTVALNSLRNFVIPLCPQHTQHLIVQEIESRLSAADKLEEDIKQSVQQAEALRQSILKKAFEGALV